MNVSPDIIASWHPTGQPLALAVAAARTNAQCIRERVRSYSVPLWQSYDFREPDGRPILDPDQSYLAGDDMDARYHEYLGKLRAAHVAHGYQVEADQCPALMADRRRILAEDALLDRYCNAAGLPSFRMYGRLRERLLDVLMRYLVGEGVPS